VFKIVRVTKRVGHGQVVQVSPCCCCGGEHLSVATSTWAESTPCWEPMHAMSGPAFASFDIEYRLPSHARGVRLSVPGRYQCPVLHTSLPSPSLASIRWTRQWRVMWCPCVVSPPPSPTRSLPRR
jgi:hypothetical protein